MLLSTEVRQLESLKIVSKFVLHDFHLSFIAGALTTKPPRQLYKLGTILAGSYIASE